MKKNYVIKAIAAALILAFALNIAACSNSGDSGGDTSSVVSETDVASVESNDTEKIELTAAYFDAVEASSYANWDGTVGYPEWAFDGDTATGLEVLKILKNINARGRTVIIVTHNPEIAEACDRIITIQDGRVA